jgi:hypothetical protein
MGYVGRRRAHPCRVRRAHWPALPRSSFAPFIVPLSRLKGATPTRLAICRRERAPSSGTKAISVRATILPTPGVERSNASRSRMTSSAATSRSISRSISSISFFRLRHRDEKPAPHQRARHATASVLLLREHVRKLASARHQRLDLAEIAMRCHPWFGSHRLSIARDGEGIYPIGLARMPSARAKERT